MALTYTGNLQTWYFDKLMEQKTYYWSDSIDNNDDIPEKDENGIETIKHIVDDTMIDLESNSIEVSGGQLPHLNHNINILNEKNERMSNYHNKCIGLSTISCQNNAENNKLVLSCINTVYLYDLNKQCASDVYLGGRYDITLPKRQHLFSIDNTLIGWDWNCVKLWDTRMGILPHTSINGCGGQRLGNALGFNISGHSFIATGGSDEAVTIWDVRRMCNVNDGSSAKPGALYEMSTGNNTVHELAWNESSLTLFAITDCTYVDRLGYKHYGDDTFGMSYDCDDDDDDEMNWPQAAVHKKGFFKSDYDSGGNALFAYSFMS